MIPTKNHNSSGFTFVEVMAALALIGIVLTAILTLQSTIFSKAIGSTDRLDRITMLKNFMREQLFKIPDVEDPTQLKTTKNVADPKTTIEVTVSSVSEKSALKKFDNLYTVKAEGTWLRDGQKRDLGLVSFVHKRPPEKKKE